MPEDATTPPFEPTPPPPKGSGAVTTTTSTQTETTGTIPTGGKLHGSILGMSGRFWIALIFSIGAVLLMVLVFFYPNIDPNTLGFVMSGFLPLAANIVGTYMGQNSKVKTPGTV
jgi:hypothetical protein